MSSIYIEVNYLNPNFSRLYIQNNFLLQNFINSSYRSNESSEMHATPFGQRQNSTHFTNYEEIVRNEFTFANVKFLMTYKCIIKILIEFIQHIRKNESTKDIMKMRKIGMKMLRFQVQNIMIGDFQQPPRKKASIEMNLFAWFTNVS